MAKSSSYNSKKPDPDMILEKLKASEKDQLKQRWNEFGTFGHHDLYITDEDTEAALQHVREKAGIGSRTKSVSEKDISRPITPVFWNYLAAALILLTIGAGYVLYPLTTTVPYGETASFTLPDGSEIQLNSGSSYQHNRLFGYTNRNLKFNGEAFFDVKPGSSVFSIQANGAVVEVLGTSFNLRSWSDDPGAETRISVVSGEVRFAPVDKKKDSVLLTRNMTSSWNSTRSNPTDPTVVSMDRILAWRHNNLAFTNQPLSVIFNELERKFNVEIQVENRMIEESVLTTFYTGPVRIETVLNDITTVKGLKYTRTANGYRIDQ